MKYFEQDRVELETNEVEFDLDEYDVDMNYGNAKIQEGVVVGRLDYDEY